MDAAMPQGFFGNTQEIYAEVASYPVVPPEKIKQYWNAYTTTFRRLFDPGAFRLENFWWHVWGSDRLRNLSGPALARLFEEFSTGPTFVPLPPPVNPFTRSQPAVSRRRRAGGNAANQAEPSGESAGQDSAPADNRRGLTPSSSRPPPPHPILKKSRGPSASGPRPTARFASPPTTSEEVIQDVAAISASAAASAAAMPPPPLPPSALQKAGAPTNDPTAPETPEPGAGESRGAGSTQAASESNMGPSPSVPSARGERSATTVGRKVMATTAASRRKPVVMRRLSSQSSTGSDSGLRVAGFVTASRRAGSKRSTSAASQLPAQGSSSSQTSDVGISAKAAGKRRIKAPAGKRSAPQAIPAEVDNQPDEPAPPQLLRPASPQRRSTWDSRDSLATTAQAPPPVAGFVADQPFARRVPSILRSRSNQSDASQGPPDRGVALFPAQPTSSVATFTTTARGQFDSETVTAEPAVPEARDIPDQVRYSSHSSSSALEQQQQFRPTPPDPAPSIPFGRSKSELTLLLARGKPSKSEDS